MTLRQLMLDAFPDHPAPDSLPDVPVSGLECDSRKIERGFVFVALRGAKLDGNAFIGEAARRGASAVIADAVPDSPTGVPVVSVPDSREAAARLASAFYGHPSKRLKIVGVTGTNGKTTTTYLAEFLLDQHQKKPGVIGTVSYRYAGVETPAVETTPGPLDLQRLFSAMVQSGCESAVMEVSSHALDQHRVGGIDFTAAVFTNLTQDHLDYHGSMQAYFESKAKLFSGLSSGSTAVLNCDDAWSAKLAGLTAARVLTFGIERDADLRALSLRRNADSMDFELVHRGRRTAVSLPLIGRHNVYNALAALGVCEALGVPVEEAARSLRAFPGVPGRLEAVRCGQPFTVLVDFAHTPDGLENVLQALAEHRQKKLFVVFGCGGDRDRTKRPKMAAIAAQWADFVYVTSDNPRSEKPQAIADEICAGFPSGFRNRTVVLDRRKAIRQALLAARAGDIVLLAGKGHERAQIIGDQALPFSDREEAEKVLNGH